jgi:hypothetical protein
MHPPTQESAQPAALVMTGPQRAPLLSNDDEAPTAQDVDESQELITSKVRRGSGRGAD